MDRHYRQSKETKWKWTDTPDNRKGRSGNAQTLQTVEGDKVEMDRHSRQSKGTKWKWTDTPDSQRGQSRNAFTPDSRRGQSGNGQTLQTVEGDKVEMDRHSVAMELCSGNELKVQIYKGQ